MSKDRTCAHGASGAQRHCANARAEGAGGSGAGRGADRIPHRVGTNPSKPRCPFDSLARTSKRFPVRQYVPKKNPPPSLSWIVFVPSVSRWRLVVEMFV